MVNKGAVLAFAGLDRLEDKTSNQLADLYNNATISRFWEGVNDKFVELERPFIH